MKYRPRNDFVVIEKIDLGKVGSILTPQKSAQGKQLTVLAIGPDVEDLQVGDHVFVIGTPGEDVVALPNENTIFLTRQANVILVVEEEVE